MTKCADDSETANYISANTKDVRLVFTLLFVSMHMYAVLSHLSFQCPKCQVCIEKNGGCNHMVNNDYLIIDLCVK